VKLLSFLHEDCILLGLNADSKRDAIKQLTDLFIERGRVPRAQAKGLLEALMAREKLGSTGIGRGIAVPHAGHASAKEPMGAVGVASKGIDFQSLDGQPVDLIFLLVYPVGHGDRLGALKQLSAFVRQHDLCRFLRQTSDTHAAFEVIQEADTKLQSLE
jgi:mannitol/fructose-specific phosphotransferase system IIA component (Ntr-type)